MTHTPATKNLLVVEDQSEIADYFAELFSEAGYKVTKASDGLEGLDALDHAHFDIVVTDYMMPRMNGYNFVIKAKQKFPHLKFCVCTSEPTNVYQKFLDIGVHFVWEKRERTEKILGDLDSL